jgi:hypothetical protein
MKLSNKKTLVEILKEEGYNKINIFDDGTWTIDINTNEAITSINRVLNYNLNNNDIKELLLNIELLLNK